jgi:N-acetylglucosamine-6-sulfatase
VAPAGGEDRFHDTMKDQSTVATWLNNVGYQTKFVGKYMNDYDEMYVPPGWDEWFGWLGPPQSQRVNDDGKVFEVQGHATDLFADKSVDFINRASNNPEPFFLSVWTHAPHQPAIPAPATRTGSRTRPCRAPRASTRRMFPTNPVSSGTCPGSLTGKSPLCASFIRTVWHRCSPSKTC